MLLFLTMIDKEEDRSKFVQIYERYACFMWFLANERLHDAGLAEDAVQEAFLALTRHMDKVGEVNSAATKNFLATIVKNKAIDMVRKNSRTPEEEFEDSRITEFQKDILDSYLERENYQRILDAVGRLDDIYRVVFEYKYLHELSDREIADLLGVTPKTVNVRIFRARKKLQSMLEQA